MFQGFPGDYDSGSRCSSSPSAESQYLSSVDSFGSPAAAAAAAAECGALGDMPGSFVPTVTAITSSQDLQWLVQPTLSSSVAQPQPPGPPMAHPPPVDPYDLPGPSYSAPGVGAFPPAAPPQRPARARPRRSRDETLTPEEEEKRRVRRERNKLAAAKCRNRRRELTDRLQAETEQLEEARAELESEIAELRKEKERLEFALVAHAPACKVPFEDPGPPPAEVSSSSQEEPQGTVQGSWQGPPVPSSSCCFFFGAGVPPNPLPTSPFVFTHPEAGATCGASHQRSSSSDQSSDSLNSPSLLAL